MKFTSINISNTDHNFKYIIGYSENNHYSVNDYPYYKQNENIYIHNNDYTNWIHNNNIWEKYDDTITTPLQSNVRTSNITLYFPEYSVETYSKKVDYALTINVWINNKSVYLGTYIINRFDSLASEKVMDFYNQKYYECITMEIPNPWDVIYSDDWKDWRKNVCETLVKEDGIESNNEGTLLNFTLYPVVKTGNIYTKHSEYDGGQNSIKLDEHQNSLHHNLSVEKEKEPGLMFVSTIQFNEAYTQDINGFIEYLKETYGIDNCVLRYDYYIQDEENVYGYYSTFINDNKCILSKFDIDNTEFNFNTWDKFKDGMYITGSLNIINKDKITEEEGILMTIMSNNIPLTAELYKFLIVDKSNEVDFIKLNLIDMNVYEINAVNKIQQNVIQLDRPKDYKSNLIRPVYYRTRELGNVVFHPAVTENICINLDAYKSQADSFILKLEGVNFKEQARVSNGVIFKIVGNMLPSKVTAGVYYILNENEELITTGKYTYES